MTTTVAVAEDDGYMVARDVLRGLADELTAQNKARDAAVLLSALAILIRYDTDRLEV